MIRGVINVSAFLALIMIWAQAPPVVSALISIGVFLAVVCG